VVLKSVENFPLVGYLIQAVGHAFKLHSF